VKRRVTRNSGTKMEIAVSQGHRRSRSSAYVTVRCLARRIDASKNRRHS
jgi:hypothetical protein